MPILGVGDRRVSYEDYGCGPVVLLIHGSPGNARAWARVGERLAGRFRVVAPDLPGYGETTPQPPGETPALSYASELVEALVREVGPPAVLAGHSYGGVVALAVALRGRVSIGALLLLEPVALKVLPVAGDAEAFTAAKAVFDDYIAGFENGDGKAVRKMVDFWFGPGAFDRMPDNLTAYLVKESAANIRDVHATFGESYDAASFSSLTMPVSIVVGGESPDVTHRIAHAIAALVPGASLGKLEGADHALTTTHADAVAAAITDLSA